MPVYDFTSPDGVTGYWRIPGANAPTPNPPPPNANWAALTAPAQSWDSMSPFSQYALVDRRINNVNEVFMALNAIGAGGDGSPNPAPPNASWAALTAPTATWSGTSAYAQYTLVNRTVSGQARVYMALNAITAPSAGTTYNEVARYNDSAASSKRVSGGSAYHSIPEVCVNHTAASGTFPSTTTGTWRLRYEPSGSATQAAASITGNLTVLFAGNDANPYRCIRVGNSGDYVSTFGVGSSNATDNSPARFFGGTWRLERQTTGTGTNTAPESDSTNWMLVSAWSGTAAYAINAAVSNGTPTAYFRAIAAIAAPSGGPNTAPESDTANWTQVTDWNNLSAYAINNAVRLITISAGTPITTNVVRTWRGGDGDSNQTAELNSVSIGTLEVSYVPLTGDSFTSQSAIQSYLEGITGNVTLSRTGGGLSNASVTGTISNVSESGHGTAFTVGSTSQMTAAFGSSPSSNSSLTWTLSIPSTVTPSTTTTSYYRATAAITAPTGGSAENERRLTVYTHTITPSVNNNITATGVSWHHQLSGNPNVGSGGFPNLPPDGTPSVTVSYGGRSHTGTFRRNVDPVILNDWRVGSSLQMEQTFGTTDLQNISVSFSWTIPAVTERRRGWRRRTELQTGDRVLAYTNDPTVARNSSADINLGATGSFRAALATATRLYFVEEFSDQARAYDHSGNRQSSDDINLGTGQWEGGFATATRLYFIDTTADYARAWDHTGIRQSADDISLGTSLGESFWNGGAATATRLYFVENNSNYARAWDHNGNRQSANDISLSNGAWRGAFSTSTRLYFIDNSSDYARAYDHAGTRQAADDINLGTGNWDGGAATATRVYLLHNNEARAYDLLPNNLIWRTV